MAARVRAASSFVIKRPALACVGAAFGSSTRTGALGAFADTVVESVVARAVRRPSGVTNSACAACRSYSSKITRVRTKEYEC